MSVSFLASMGKVTNWFSLFFFYFSSCWLLPVVLRKRRMQRLGCNVSPCISGLLVASDIEEYLRIFQKI